MAYKRIDWFSYLSRGIFEFVMDQWKHRMFTHSFALVGDSVLGHKIIPADVTATLYDSEMRRKQKSKTDKNIVFRMPSSFLC